MSVLPQRTLRWLLLAFLVPALLMPRGLAFSWCGCEAEVASCCGASEEPPSCCADAAEPDCCETGGFGFELANGDPGEGCECCQAIEFDIECELSVEKAVEHAMVLPAAALATIARVLPPATLWRPAPVGRAPPDDVRPPGLWPGVMPMRR